MSPSYGIRTACAASIRHVSRLGLGDDLPCLAHAGDQSGATTTRAQCEIKVNEVADMRREIQYAADIIWPATRKANAGIRVEFKLPPARALR